MSSPAEIQRGRNGLLPKALDIRMVDGKPQLFATVNFETARHDLEPVACVVNFDTGAIFHPDTQQPMDHWVKVEILQLARQEAGYPALTEEQIQQLERSRGLLPKLRSLLPL